LYRQPIIFLQTGVAAVTLAFFSTFCGTKWFEVSLFFAYQEGFFDFLHVHGAGRKGELGAVLAHNLDDA
jgi:hypothetical protein